MRRRKTLAQVSMLVTIVFHRANRLGAQFFVRDDDQEEDGEEFGNRHQLYHDHDDEAADAIRQANAVTERARQKGRATAPQYEQEPDDGVVQQAWLHNMDMYCIDIPVSLAACKPKTGVDLFVTQARLADDYIERLNAVNASLLLPGGPAVLAPFAPSHHVYRDSTLSSRRRKLYFYLASDISYTALRNCSPFQSLAFDKPINGSAYTVTPQLPATYTIVPKSEWHLLDTRGPLFGWKSFEPNRYPAGSLVRVRAPGTYFNSLGYVIGASDNRTNECALVAVVPSVAYPDSSVLDHRDPDAMPPSKKQRRNTPPKLPKPTRRSHPPQLFSADKVLHRPHEPQSQQTYPYPSDYYAVDFAGASYNLQRFFQEQCSDCEVNEETYEWRIDDFSWAVRQEEVTSVPKEVMVRREPSAREMEHGAETFEFPATKLVTTTTAPTIYRYCGHIYYLGLRIVPIYRRASLTFNQIFQPHEILPFVEARLAPSIFDPLISQMHWKRGDKIIETASGSHYPYYAILSVDLVEGTVITHQVESVDDQDHAGKVPLEFTMSSVRLRVVAGDHIQVIAGNLKGQCGTVLRVDLDMVYVMPYGSNPQNQASLHSEQFSALLIQVSSSIHLPIGFRPTKAQTLDLARFLVNLLSIRPSQQIMCHYLDR